MKDCGEIDIREDEWRAELERLGELGGGDGDTCSEIAERHGISVRRMSGILRRGVAAGRYIKGRGIRTNVDGAEIKVPVYQLNEGEEPSQEEEP